MSRMKHLLRKLHIGGSLNDQHTRLPNDAPSTSAAAAAAAAAATTSPNLPSSSSSTPPQAPIDAAGGGVVDFLEEEFQVQLALAISASASDSDAREDPESVQIKAAKRMSLGCSPNVPADETLVELLSLRYWGVNVCVECVSHSLTEEVDWSYNVVNYDEKVMDGFYDVYGIASDSTVSGKMPPLVDLQTNSISDDVDYEVILVNRIIDPVLQQLEQTTVSLAVQCRASEFGPVASGLVQKMADLVVGAMGGPVGDAFEMLNKWKVRSDELRTSLKTIVLPLGCLDVGLSRHRALLFKVLADRISLPCRLVKGSYYTGSDEGAINLIKVDYDSEYIIDLMGAPGTLIPAEIPSNHVESGITDLMNPVAIEHPIKDLKLMLDGINSQAENRNRIMGGIYSDVNFRQRTGAPVSDETSIAGIQLKQCNVNLDEKNRTEKFEYEFGKLLPSIQKSNRGLSGITGKPSPAQKMKIKDVSKYVINAAQNPEFAQKLHAVLLQSGASPPPDLFSDLASDHHSGEQEVQSHFIKATVAAEFLNQPDSESKENHYLVEMAGKAKEHSTIGSDLKHGRTSSDLFSTDKNALAKLDLQLFSRANVPGRGFCLPTSTGSDGLALVDKFAGVHGWKDSATAGKAADSSEAFNNCSHKEKIYESSEPCLGSSFHGKLAVALTGDGTQFLDGNMGQLQFPRENNTIGSMLGMETINNDQNIASNAHSTTDTMLDEVAEWEILWDDIQLGERIGLGSYGEVYRADLNGTEVAVKKFLDQDFSGDALDQFRCEVKIMLRLRHPNVVLFMGAVTRPPNLSILTEFLPRGSLYRLLHRPNIQLDEKRRLKMALDVAKGMNYLHTSHPTIVHRDLKSPNLLVDKNWTVKVCDFGLSRLKHHTFLSSKSTAGTPEWMAPEVLRNEPSNEKCDVYSFGVILWELATMRMPWSGMNPMQVVGAVGFQNRRLDIPEDVDPMIAQTIRDCWQSDPNLRPSFSQLMSHLKRLHRLVVDKENGLRQN
ncbi:hypothetical protein Sjap_019833 [Stephania japonica]|uniref:non-specific serine/threonine protein kinase n=1 Tax=Stephania japonica TaxID=461633 RepID=A0AAP0F8G2_9MAGN